MPPTLTFGLSRVMLTGGPLWFTDSLESVRVERDGGDAGVWVPAAAPRVSGNPYGDTDG